MFLLIGVILDVIKILVLFKLIFEWNSLKNYSMLLSGPSVGVHFEQQQLYHLQTLQTEFFYR